jgi:hypothetical protein
MSLDISNCDSDESNEEDIPEYRKITNENMYEFIIWANGKKLTNISVNYFNIIIQSNIHNWIETNNISWEFALTLVTDIINNQNNIDSLFDISSNSQKNNKNCESNQNVKPTSIEERRRLFAEAAEKRAKSRF